MFVPDTALVAALLVVGAVFAWSMRGARRAQEAASRAERTAAAQEASARAAVASAEIAVAEAQCVRDEVMDRCGAAVLLLSPSGTVLRANDVAARILGVATPQLIGKPLLGFTLSADLRNLLEAAPREGEITGREFEIGSRTIQAAAAALPQGDGAPQLLVVAQDVTELRRLEAIRREFVANVSHELRTPLASIRAMAETLQDGALGDPTVADRFLETIVNEAQRLTRISDDLLVLAQAESRSPQKRPLDLTALLETVTARVKPQAERARITLTAKIAPHLLVLGDGDQMEQVVVNLIDNALKYTPGDGRVEVSARADGDQAVVRVADTGIGILSEDLPRIFERFYRVDKARSRRSGGTGLGLSIVKHIVESHGGIVQVQSEYNRGSTFTFSLPLAPEESN